MVDKIVLELPADTVGGDIVVSTETRERAEQAAAQAEDARDQAQVYAANTVELQDTTFTALIADEDSATRTQLNATFVAYAPAPTGVKATDEANVQPLVTMAQNTGGTVILQTGSYVMDIATSRMDRQPRIVGQGEKLTSWNGTLSLAGVPGAFSGGYLSDFSFVGTRATNTPFLRIRGAISVTWERIAFNGTADIGILFENDSAHTFTEMCAGQAHFNNTVKCAVEYRVSAGGNPSFNGCGLTRGSTINQATSDTGPKIFIGPDAEPYNAPLAVTFWARTAVPLIRHEGRATSTFYGDMKIELLPPNSHAIIVDPTSAADLPLAGSLSRRGKLVLDGRLVVASEVATETGVARPMSDGAEVRYRTPGNVLSVSPEGKPEWVPRIRTNRARNPVAGNSTTFVSAYLGSTVAAPADTSLGGTNVFTFTTTNTTQLQGIAYLQSASDLVPGQVKTIAFDVLSPVDATMFAGGRFGLSGTPGIAEVGERGAVGDTEYIAANRVHRVRRHVIVPPANSEGTVTHEGFYVRFNTLGDMPAVGTVVKVSNVTIEDGVIAGSKFSGADTGEWTGVQHQSTSVQYPSQPKVSTAEVAYTPTLTNVEIGNGEIVARYAKVGKRVQGSVYMKVGSTTSITGTIQVGLPSDAPLVAGSKRRYSGEGWCNDFSASERFVASVLPLGTTALTLRVMLAGTGGYIKQVPANATAPFAWGVDDELLIAFEYETA